MIIMIIASSIHSYWSAAVAAADAAPLSGHLATCKDFSSQSFLERLKSPKVGSRSKPMSNFKW